MTVLSDFEIRSEIDARLPGWSLDGGALTKRFTFRGFSAAMEFIDRMAEVAKASRHHPDFCSHYDVVDVSVTTHSAGGVTAADLALARGIEAAAML
ncbi:MAG: 4a-hydroxytetrahydrobiopterin dehydratase [Actinomycetota bacterium]|nr:4a-hydroxytetrahydrobiopterin dehydratase [Actinomycetota bacterium]